MNTMRKAVAENNLEKLKKARRGATKPKKGD
jgi:hypothetical protein